jgi:hypothetical protein
VEVKADTIIRGLSEEAEELNKKLNKLKMACFYCNVRLSPNVVNETC